MALDDIPNQLESVWIQRNPLNQFYEQINISGSDLIVYHSSSGELMADKISVWAAKYGIGTGGGGSTAKVSAVDTTAGYLSQKIVQGANISITVINPGANETMSIASAGGAVSDQATLASQSLVASASFVASSSFYASSSIYASSSAIAYSSFWSSASAASRYASSSIYASHSIYASSSAVANSSFWASASAGSRVASSSIYASHSLYASSSATAISSLWASASAGAWFASSSIYTSHSLYASSSVVSTTAFYASASFSSSFASSSLTSSHTYFNGNRSITRSPYSGINLGTDNVVNFLNEFFFPFVPATISINGGTTYYETGSVPSVTVNGSVTSNTETVFQTGSIRRNGTEWYIFPSASSYSTTETGVSSSRTYQTAMQVGNNGSPTLIFSSTKTVTFLYPYIMGLSSVAGLSGTTLYTTLVTKSVSTQASPYKTGSFGGTAQYIYFCYPVSFTALNSIKDPNNFEILSSFEYSASVPVTSSGLPNTAMGLYRVYRTALQSNPNGTYQFYHS